jgi:hypothetical protein
MRGLGLVLSAHFPVVITEGSVAASAEDKLSAITRVISALSACGECIEQMSRNVHETWMRAKKAHGFSEQSDPRLSAKFDDLTKEAKAITRQNARADILAVALSLHSAQQRVDCGVHPTLQIDDKQELSMVFYWETQGQPWRTQIALDPTMQ